MKESPEPIVEESATNQIVGHLQAVAELNRRPEVKPRHLDPELHLHWEGPFEYAPELMAAAVQGDIAIDESGTMRQYRYANSHMPAGWTHKGDSPLSTFELLADGHKAWLLRGVR